MPTQGLAEGEKFAVVAVTNCDHSLESPAVLPHGTIVLLDSAPLLNPQWKIWLGESRTDDIENANLFLIRHAPSARPNILDSEHEKLAEQVSDIFGLLQFSGIPQYGGAVLLKGSIEADEFNVRQIANVRDFYLLEGKKSETVTLERLRHAEKRGRAWGVLRVASDEYDRFKRGANILMDGLHRFHGQDRLHQYVRSLEALILPSQGKTKKQFVSRCRAFVCPDAANDDLFREWFDMRSDVEHVHEWDRSLKGYSPSDRRSIAERRTRQAEILVTAAYGRVLDEPDLQSIYQSDSTISDFWALPEKERAEQWSLDIDLHSIP